MDYTIWLEVTFIPIGRPIMETVTVSQEFQIVIPRSIRQSLGLEPGQKLQAIQYENRIELIPVKPIQEMRGFLKGIDTTIEREPDRI
jgi:AbrB family looped-hinge helix DNA binding protein